MNENIIEFNHVSLWYDEVIALNEVSFKFEPGITGLVGSNGAGKTSSLKLAASLVRPTLGEVKINGEDVWKNYPYLGNMGFCPEIDRQYDWMTGRNFLHWMGKFQGLRGDHLKEHMEVVLDQVSMTHAADRQIEGYSRGMRQRIKVAQALLHEPDILLVDEPMSGTDPIGRNILINLFKDLSHEGRTIVVSSHVLHELERIADRILVLESGKLVAEGTVSGVRTALSKIPQRVRLTTDTPGLVSKLIADNDNVKGLKIESDGIIVEVSNRFKFTEFVVGLSEEQNFNIFEIKPLDDDLTSVFKLIKNRKITD